MHRGNDFGGNGVRLHKDNNRTNAQGWTRYGTLCGRTNRACNDGMNVADTDADVTCKFCLAKMAARAAVIARHCSCMSVHCPECGETPA